jgi:hypothetical protein
MLRAALDVVMCTNSAIAGTVADLMIVAAMIFEH